MNCRRIVNLISAYIDGELTGNEMLAIRRHLSECPECAEEYESMRMMKQAVARLKVAAPRQELAASIFKMLDEVEVSPYQRYANSLIRFAHQKLSPVAAALTASGLALVLLTAGGAQRGRPQFTDEVAAAFGSRTQEVSFLRELHDGSLPISYSKPLKVADDRFDHSVQLASLSVR